MNQLVALRELRTALDRAREHLEPLAGVIAAWEASQSGPQAPAPKPTAARKPAEALAASDGAPRPTVGLFDPLPAPVPPARRQSGNGATSTSCERCRVPLEQQARGARRRFCGTTCRLKAKTERVPRREADPGLELLPDRLERPFTVFEHPDDFRSDAELLRPPRLSWELEERAAP